MASDKGASDAFHGALKAERSYGAKLRGLVKQIHTIVTAHAPAPAEHWSPPGLAALNASLTKYAQAITPWAVAVGKRMVEEANRRNIFAWRGLSLRMSRGLKTELSTAPTGEAMGNLLARQVELITSLPKSASERVHEMSVKALVTGERFAERESDIKQALAEAHPAATAKWLINRATLIARTETARAASTLTQARAEFIGADRYYWLSARDARVRDTHAKLDARSKRGETFLWSDPPVSEADGTTRSHPGQVYNCRCIAMPVIPTE